MFVASRLSQSRHNVYYLRFPLPRALHPDHKTTHIKLSLGTRNPSEALRLAKTLEYHAQTILSDVRLQGMTYQQIKTLLTEHFRQRLEESKRAMDENGRLPSGQVKALENSIQFGRQGLRTGDYVDNEGHRKNVEQFIDLFGLQHIASDAEKRKKFERELEKAFVSYCENVLAYDAALDVYDLTVPQSAKDTKAIAGKTFPIADVIEKYIEENTRTTKSWREKTEIERRGQYEVLCEIVGGEFDIQRFDAETARRVKDIVVKLPANRNKIAATRGLSLMDAIKVSGVKKISAKTINEYLTAYSSLFRWAEQQGYIERNFFSGLKPKNIGKDQKERNPFTSEQIAIMLHELENPSLNPHQYWGVLIGLYTGARLEEIAQLHLDDVKQEDGIWYFDINDKGATKTLKNKSSIRRVPIHPALFDMGFETYLNDLKKNKSERLFPTLQYNKKHGYSRSLGRWFNEKFIPHLFPNSGLTFHCLRHTVITHLRRSDNELPKVQDILGHTKESVTENVYNHGYTLKQLQAVIETLRY